MTELSKWVVSREDRNGFYIHKDDALTAAVKRVVEAYKNATLIDPREREYQRDNIATLAQAEKRKS